MSCENKHNNSTSQVDYCEASVAADGEHETGCESGDEKLIGCVRVELPVEGGTGWYEIPAACERFNTQPKNAWLRSLNL